ncbi:hypothetical protein [Isoalcanivorax indicus]|uniref:hypothetical protein n=1 Tax=Isoalcanivorax indicus TaxID=2202653 RepID=UPI000DBA21E9|nr:hypothetical protein [Isoalcanivorax indicus]
MNELAPVVIAGLVWAALAAALLRQRTALGQQRRALAHLLLVAVGLSLAALLQGWSGSVWLGLGGLSLTSGLLALGFLLMPWWPVSVPLLPMQDRRMLILALPPLAALLWWPPLAGISGDLWALGFGDFRVSTVLLCVGLGLWVLRAYALCLLLVAAQCGFAVGLLPSGNLWHYLLDPWLGVAALLWWGWRLYRPGGPAAPPLAS